MKFILILTLIGNIGTGGGADVTSMEFDSLERCQEAGEKWIAKIGKTSLASRSFYMCEESQ